MVEIDNPDLATENKKLKELLDRREIELAAALDRLQKAEDRFKAAKQMLSIIAVKCAQYLTM